MHLANSGLVPVQKLLEWPDPGVALNAVQFLVWHKIFGPAQNILGPVEGQGIRKFKFKIQLPSTNPAS